MKTLFSTALATAIIAFGNQAMAQPEPDMPPPGGGPRPEMMMSMIQKLKLTADQKTKMQALRKERQAQSESLKNDIDAKRDAFHALLKSDATDSEIRKAHAALQALHQKMADANFENLMAIRAILTPEQRKEMQTHMGDQRGYRRQMGGGRHKQLQGR